LGQNTDIAKAKGSAETYAVKYFLQKLFLIPTSDNLDPDKVSGKPRELTEEEKKQVEEVLERHKLKASINTTHAKS
ncbi:9178_t:CDS:1, partial [Ambispora leptoticha]